MPALPLAPAIASRDGRPVDVDQLLLDFMAGTDALSEIVARHKLALRTFADWLDLPATREALDRMRSLIARQNEHAAPNLTRLANKALAGLIASATAAPETVRRAASDLLKAIRPTPQPRAAASLPSPTPRMPVSDPGLAADLPPDHPVTRFTNTLTELEHALAAADLALATPKPTPATTPRRNTPPARPAATIRQKAGAA